MKDMPRISTNIKGLDERLGGGIPAGFTVLICGPSGSMKSSLAFNILHHSSKDQGMRSLYVSVEQSKKSLMKQVSSLGLSIKGIKDLNVVVVAEAWMSKKIDLLYKNIGREKDENAAQYDPFENLKALHKYYPESCVYLSMLSFKDDWQEILPRISI